MRFSSDSVSACVSSAKENSDSDGAVVIVEDYGDHAGYSVDVGEDHIVDAARRWAVLLDSGTLVFADDAHLKPE